ncbi:MAG: hypothetical protein Q4A31_11415 [Corynebacterium sp.]|uniref:hypothetical protein n=1 Tax=Corynebacterium sp. TaxID=1720 RepID=UPI0026DAB0E8|nr:hypothetical protein [Corynebacterium sp.]MDO4762520.1 hypothetical protein [Corynebacterium sp.]
MLGTILYARYGSRGDGYERIAELMLIIGICISMQVEIPLVFMLISAVGTGVMAIQTMATHWNNWAQPPISAPKKLLYRDCYAASLISGPFIVTLAYALLSANVAVVLPALAAGAAVLALYPHIPRIRTITTRTRTPHTMGIAAFVAFKLRRGRFPGDSVFLAFVFVVAAVALSLNGPAYAFLCFGFSLGLVLVVAYRERDDLPGLSIRKTVGFAEYVAYLHLVIPATVLSVVGSVAVGSVFPLLAQVVATGVAVILGRVFPTYPHAHARLRFSGREPKPTLLLEYGVHVILLGVWWLVAIPAFV